MARILEKTADQWHGFTTTQKAGAVVAGAMTGFRLVAPFVIKKDRSQPWTWQDVGVRAAIAATDVADGWLTRSLGCTTEAGAFGDSLADKLAMTWHESELLGRRQLGHRTFIARGVRDALITVLRLSASDNGDKSPVSIAANKMGKATTEIRSAVDIATGSPLGERFPEIADALQTLTTVAISASGFYNVRQLTRRG